MFGADAPPTGIITNGAQGAKMEKRRDGETVKGRNREITHYASRITNHASRITHYEVMTHETQTNRFRRHASP